MKIMGSTFFFFFRKRGEYKSTVHFAKLTVALNKGGQEGSVIYKWKDGELTWSASLFSLFKM